MNNIITAETLLSSLPQVLAEDENMYALASSIADLLAARVKEMDDLSIYANIDSLPEQLLDILAYDFKIDWWDADYSIEQKRRVLKSSWEVHKRLGTAGAVSRSVAAVYSGAKVEEWFDYGGRPYHFKLIIDVTEQGLEPNKHKRMLERVNWYKNLRSVLDEVSYESHSNGAFCVSGCYETSRNMDIWPLLTTRLDSDGSTLTCAGSEYACVQEIYPDGQEESI